MIALGIIFIFFSGWCAAFAYDSFISKHPLEVVGILSACSVVLFILGLISI